MPLTEDSTPRGSDKDEDDSIQMQSTVRQKSNSYRRTLFCSRRRVSGKFKCRSRWAVKFSSLISPAPAEGGEEVEEEEQEEEKVDQRMIVPV